MSEITNLALETETIDNTEDTEDTEDNTENEPGEIIQLETGKLLKLRHNIRKLRDDVLSGFSKDIKECIDTCTVANALMGDLNDKITGEKK